MPRSPWTSSTSPVDLPGDATPVAPDAVFGPAGSGHSAGLVPDPGATAGTVRVLRENATWSPVSSTEVLAALGAPRTGLGAPPGAATAGSSFGRTEQAMLQDAYDKIRSLETILRALGLGTT